MNAPRAKIILGGFGQTFRSSPLSLFAVLPSLSASSLVGSGAADL